MDADQAAGCLARLFGGASVEPDEAILERLSVFVIWGGRYPVPTSGDDLMVLSGSIIDDGIMNSLFLRLIKPFDEEMNDLPPRLKEVFDQK